MTNVVHLYWPLCMHV